MPVRFRRPAIAALGLLLLAPGACGKIAEAPKSAAGPAWTPGATEIEAALAGRVLRKGCRQGQCAWLRVGAVEAVAAGGDGELRRLVGRAGRSVHGEADPPESHDESVPVEWEPRDSEAFAFCSTGRPAYAFRGSGGGWLIHHLDLFDLAGYQFASATMYLQLCHGRAFDPADPEALRRLGYRPGTRRGQVEGADPRSLARF